MNRPARKGILTAVRIEQLEYIAAVTRLGSLRRAAEQLHLSQPALSETVRNLERELGVDLLERKRSGAKVSDEGRELLPHIMSVLDAVDRLRGAAGDQHRMGKETDGLPVPPLSAGETLFGPAVGVRRRGVRGQRAARRREHRGGSRAGCPRHRSLAVPISRVKRRLTVQEQRRRISRSVLSHGKAHI